ncbi:uncharacterized protein BJ171DRAFT_571564 [Polychytrium aggregatum]|uniref:uncharacterized protein n=1 Tax=Polychytrium aggregatum TaxID=110093 RepID=UPI0022FF3901|nr:uncharacterized protein BJ171DRAFT_571564 [Polychytrium aggregatum]KAI9193652.1 hypothetical protein BJ171DRAFT_571564 [Polychytrium aggregatum]
MDDSSLKFIKIVAKGSNAAVPTIPAFSRTVKLYTAYVSSDVDSLVIQAPPNEADGFSQVLKLGSDGAVKIQEGQNTVEIKVDAVDGSSSIYSISVHRPSAADATLKALEFPVGILLPDFHPKELNYVLHVSSTVDKVAITPVPMNAKAKLERLQFAKTEPTPLLLGDTTCEFKVTSMDGKHSLLYRVIVRRDKPGSRMKIMSDTKDYPLCSLCSNLVFRPRIYKVLQDIKPGPCRHEYCGRCLNLFALRYTEPSAQAGKDPATIVSCPLCNISSEVRKTWSNDPLWESNHDMEVEFGGWMAKCLFAPFGCPRQDVKCIDMAAHLSKDCKHIPVGCSECQRLFNSPDQIAGGKHKDPCIHTCACGRKVYAQEEGFHAKMCPEKRSEKSASEKPPQREWEKVLVDKKKYPGDAEKLVGQASGKWSHYLASLGTAQKAYWESFGASEHMPAAEALSELAGLYATAIASNLESVSVRGGKPDENLCIQLGKALEEKGICTDLFPPHQKSKAAQGSNSSTTPSDDFMGDEVNGCLAQLNVDSGASDVVKLRALEAEYQRLLGLGLSDQVNNARGNATAAGSRVCRVCRSLTVSCSSQKPKAQEVQGLYAWKLKQVISTGGQIDDQGKAGSLSGSTVHAMEKYQDATRINPENPDAALHYGRLLLQSERIPEAIKYLRTSLSFKPTNRPVRMYLASDIFPSGLALIKCDGSGPEEISEALVYLKEALSDFYSSVSLNGLQPASGQNGELLIDTHSRPTCPAFLGVANALARGYMVQSRLDAAEETLSDLLDLLPDVMVRTNRRSKAFSAMGEAMCTALKNLLEVLYCQSSQVQAKKRFDSIKLSLLHIQRLVSAAEVEQQVSFIEASEQVAQALVILDPSQNEFLAAFGDTQLSQFDYNPKYEKSPARLLWAEEAFAASIACERPGSKEASDALAKVYVHEWYVSEKSKIEQIKSQFEKPPAPAGKPSPAEKPKAGGPPAKAAPGTKPPVAKGPGAGGAGAKAPAGAAPKTQGAAPSSGPKAAAKAQPGADNIPQAQKNMIVKTAEKVDKAEPAKKAAPGPAGKAAPAPPAAQTKKPAAANAASGAKPAGAKPMKKDASGAEPAAPPAATESKATTSDPSPAPVEAAATTPTPEAVLPPQFKPRIGVARVLSRKIGLTTGDKTQLVLDAKKWYLEAIGLNKSFHDSYIELGALVEKHGTLEEAADVYASFPFPPLDSQNPSQDDLFLHGEVTRTFMKCKRFKDERLVRSLIAEGRASSIAVISKYVEILDQASETQTLKQVFAGVNRKPIDHPDMVAFFKMKYWA